MVCGNYSFSTQRLLVNEWHSFTAEEWVQRDLAIVVMEMLTTRVTQPLPPAWQGSYSIDRARDWVKERDCEGVTLLVVEKASQKPVGLIILFDPAKDGKGAELRLGYLLAESAWGKGLASELIMGFVEWCRRAEVALITGGVNRDNIASKRVLEKSGFVCDPSTEDAAEQLFQLQLSPNNEMQRTPKARC